MSVEAQHGEDVLGRGIALLRVVEHEAFAAEIVGLGVVGVTGDGGQLGHDVDALDERLVDIGGIGVPVVVVERENGLLQLVHEVLSRMVQEVRFQKAFGQLVAFLESLAVAPEIFLGRQVAEEQQETGFLVKIGGVLRRLHHIHDVDAAVEELAVRVDFVAVLVELVADDIGDARKADEDACLVLVSEAALYVVFFEEFLGDIRIVLRFAVKLREVDCFVHDVSPFPNERISTNAL